MKEHILRMINEEKELRVKVNALRSFIDHNEIFESLDKQERKRMITQLSGMEVYLKALSDRVMVSAGDF